MVYLHWKAGDPLDNGKYIIEKYIGSGSFGVTYLAREVESDRRVVIKTPNVDIQVDPKFKEYQNKFLQEAIDLKRCSYPNIVEIYEVFQEKQLWCMVIEYIEGGDLLEYVNKHGVLSEQEALQYIQQIGEALSHVHKQGILHRDVNPNNILLRQTNQQITKQAVLIDFGLAREFIEGRTMTHTNDRTKHFAPPEQYEQQAKRGAFTDVYSLSATLYYLLTKECPLDALSRKSGYSLKPPKEYNPQISDRVNESILWGMELSHEDRPQSVQEWLNELKPRPRILLGKLKDLQHKFFNRGVSMGGYYGKLLRLLAAGKWEEADEETRLVMLKVSKRKPMSSLNIEDIKKFPCKDLRIIDQLWVHYSKGRFGFSVQKRIYQNLGSTGALWDNFGDAVGWRVDGKWVKYPDLTFNLSAQEGHFPIGWGVTSLRFSPITGEEYLSSLVSKLVECNILRFTKKYKDRRF
ncbi:MAG: GUN4 domain-containing protein [Cyanobacteria bacterium SBLK]|nr:GUN4 domain-containing protein [Cyanobacteria bacterium SBLK]